MVEQCFWCKTKTDLPVVCDGDDCTVKIEEPHIECYCYPEDYAHYCKHCTEKLEKKGLILKKFKYLD